VLKKVYKYKKKKTHFFFGNYVKKVGKLYIRRTFTNVFITLTDLNNKVIVCQTSGSSDIYENKRRKRISQAVEKIMVHINKYIKLYKLSFFHVVLKMKVKSHVYTMLSKLSFYGLGVLSLNIRRSIAHNGVRGRNLRRL
jgi:ribosomal protein S11